MNAVGTPYTCALCKGVFARERSDAEAMAVAKSREGLRVEDWMEEEAEIICDDCYKKVQEGSVDTPTTPLN